MKTLIHPSADLSNLAKIGKGTKIWNDAQIREGANIGENCVISKDVYIDKNVNVGNGVKIENGVSVFHGATIEDDVFIGANVAFTNDKYPRAFKTDWQIIPTLIKKGASIGANTTIVCGVTIGQYAMIGAGSVITKDIPDFGLAYGNPAEIKGFVNKEGKPVQEREDKE